MIYLVLSITLIVIDQISKIYAVKYLMPVNTVEVIKNVFSFTYVENRGAAFGIMQNSRWFFITFTIVVIIAIVLYTVIKKPKNILYMTSSTLIFSGGVANLIDRIFRGYVVDMLEITFIEYPVFNFADVCVVIGAILFCIYVITEKPTEKSETENGNS